MINQQLTRCPWANTHPLLTHYHDVEWGVPQHDETSVFELFSLDCFQAGLSWLTMLKKREAFRAAFNGFEIDKVAAFTEAEADLLLGNAGIIRNKLKIQAVINNARLAQHIRKEYTTFSAYIWSFSQGKTICNHWQLQTEIPVTSAISDAMSRDMVKRGFKFAGSTICYAFMQSIGMVNDHLVTCFRYNQLT